MRRILISLWLCLSVFTQMPLHALGLGEMATHSSMNEPLRAEIGLSDVANTRLPAIQAKLASEQDFQLAGISYVPLLGRLQFQVLNTTAGQPVIRVRSDTPITEPFLNFLLEVNWPNGRLLREYTVLLDPPGAAGRSGLAPIQAKPAAALVAASAARMDAYGPVKPQETLWGIANRLRPAGVTTQQMAVALRRANPQAFVDGNINHLRKGQILRIPNLNETLKVRSNQATRLFRQQLDASPAATNPIEKKKPPQRGTQNTAAQNGNASQRPPGRLQIAAPGPDQQGAAGSGEGQGDTQADSAFTQQLIRARENAETARQESKILRSQVDDLQARLSDMQRLLSLKDAQLAQLQDNIQRQSAAETETETQNLPASGTEAPTSPAQNPTSPDDQAIPPPDANLALVNPATLPDTTAPKAENLIAPDLAENAQTSDAGQPAPGLMAKLKNGWDRVLAAATYAWNALIKQPLYLAAIGVVLLLLLIWLIIRRKQQEQAVEEIASQDPFDVDYSATPTASSVAMALDENDPINQADLHIAYGRFQQAENVLQEAQHNFPGRLDIRYKLFEVYHATQNTTAFNTLAQQMLDENQPQNDPYAWAEVVAMGAELEPDNPHFNAAAPTDDEAATQDDNPQEIAFTLQESPEPEQPPEQSPEQPPGQSPEQPPGQSPEQPPEEGLPAKQSPAQQPPPADANPPAMQLAALDQPLDIEHAFNSVVNESQDTVQLELEPAEPDNEEAKNKLDLARVYIDMGDAEGAYDILQEVQEEGSQRQKNQAAELLTQIA